MIDGTGFFITVVDVDTFTFDLDDNGLGAITSISSMRYSYNLSVSLAVSIPSTCKVGDIIQLFRTNPSPSEDSSPDPRYYKIFEAALVQADITRTCYLFTDEQPSLALAGGEELYTNYTAEGESQAAWMPPRAKDIALFKGYLFFANFDQFKTLELNLVTPNLLSNGSTITVAGSVYKYVGNAANEPLGNSLCTKSASIAAGTVTVTAPNAFTAGDVIYVTASSFGVVEGLYTVATAGGSNFTFASGSGSGSGTITFEGRTDGS
jgi:hypothetical protein